MQKLIIQMTKNVVSVGMTSGGIDREGAVNDEGCNRQGEEAPLNNQSSQGGVNIPFGFGWANTSSGGCNGH